MLNFGSSFLQQ